MRRAILPILILQIAFFMAATAGADEALMNGIGLIDYGRRPDFKVGTWTRYHVTGHSSLGHSDDYEMTIGIAGEEMLWGEPCFWVETSTSSKTSGSYSVATLMSYAVFDDSLPFVNMQYYTRKNITETDALGVPQEVIARRPPQALKTRPTRKRNLATHIDTLGVDTIRVAKGAYLCRHVRIRQDLGLEMEVGDSTVFSETKDNRDSYVSTQIPLTRIAREDIDFLATTKTWMAGRSSDAPTNVITHSSGQAVLVDFGDDYQAQVIAESKRHPFRESERAAMRPSAPAKRRAIPRKPG